MTVRAALALLPLALLAACGGSEPVREVQGFRLDAPYVPPPPLEARAKPTPKPKVQAPSPEQAAKRGPAPTAAEAGVAEGAPTDAEVKRELEQAFGTSQVVNRAALTGDGLASVPPAAPGRVEAIIRAANQVARLPYVYGGGHATWEDSAFDCSGSVSFALAAAGLLHDPHDSSSLMRWGAPGPGKWVTVFANARHAWMVVAGLRFDTSGLRRGGSRWTAEARGGGGFVARHPKGL